MTDVTNLIQAKLITGVRTKVIEVALQMDATPPLDLLSRWRALHLVPTSSYRLFR